MGEYYTAQGGLVTYIGKPFKNVYDECLKFFDTNNVQKILCIGDSLHTYIAGANALGAGSVFVAGGIHKKDIFVNSQIDDVKLNALFKAEKQEPTYLVNEFSW